MRPGSILILVTATITACAGGPVGRATGILEYDNAHYDGQPIGNWPPTTLTGDVRYVYLLKGPGFFEPQITRHLIFSTLDVGIAIRTCREIECASSIAVPPQGSRSSGVLRHLSVLWVDVDPSPTYGPNLKYQIEFYSGLASLDGYEKAAVLTASVDTPTRLAGTLTFSKRYGRGPRVGVDIEFDAPLFKAFDK